MKVCELNKEDYKRRYEVKIREECNKVEISKDEHLEKDWKVLQGSFHSNAKNVCGFTLGGGGR